MKMVTEKVLEFWDCLDTEAVVNKRELFLGILVCVLTGVLAGIMVSPKKRVTIGGCSGECIAEEIE
ncbi:MAG: hypothetical protein HFH11_10950 [Dorea sp.]|jgi:hypothetical protein|nr:hypothetical protein [Dorea sp.]